MRHIALLAATCITLPGPALSWEFTSTPICTLSRSEETVDTIVTYDPATAEYAIALTAKDSPWPRSAAFGIRFEGARPNLIVTERHQLSQEDRTLTVTDSGFGNVLNGLEFNDVAIAMTGDRAVAISLDEAADAVAAFRACIAAPIA